MISRRDMLGKKNTDGLDDLIQWTLKERMSGAVPSPQVWERIAKCVGRGAALRQARWGLIPFLRAVVVWLSVDTSLPLAAQRTQRGEAALWGDNLTWAWALDQHHMLMRSVT